MLGKLLTIIRLSWKSAKEINLFGRDSWYYGKNQAVDALRNKALKEGIIKPFIYKTKGELKNDQKRED